MKFLSRIVSASSRGPHFIRQVSRRLLGKRFAKASGKLEPRCEPDWAADEAFRILSDFAELTDGKVHCARIAVCNTDGETQTVFEVGEAIHVYLEFEVLEDIGVAHTTVQLGDGAGRLSLTAGADLHRSAKAGQFIRVHHVVYADVCPGPLFFDIGLDSVSPEISNKFYSGQLSREQFAKQFARHCFRRLDAPRIDVVNPPGRLISKQVSKVALGARQGRVFCFDSKEPFETLLHITHYKSGSQWIYAILRELFPYRIVPPQTQLYQVRSWPLQEGGVYPTVYIGHDEFLALFANLNCQKFIVIRDLRDTLISHYYSFVSSHPMVTEGLIRMRERLCSQSVEEGLIDSMQAGVMNSAEMQQSWARSGEPFIRYEDLIANDFGILKAEFIDRMRLPITEEQLQAAVEKHRFEMQTGGRRRGEERVGSHHRKGIAGDWRNHFTPKVTEVFKEKFGQILIETGYEKDLNW